KTRTTKQAQPQTTEQAQPQDTTFPPVPLDVLAECLQVAPGKSIPIDLATGEVVKPAKRIPTTISSNMLATLQAMKDGNAMSHNAIAGVTGRDKGNKLRELTAMGLVTTTEQEGSRGYVYTITDAGKKAIADAAK